MLRDSSVLWSRRSNTGEGAETFRAVTASNLATYGYVSFDPVFRGVDLAKLGEALQFLFFANARIWFRGSSGRCMCRSMVVAGLVGCGVG